MSPTTDPGDAQLVALIARSRALGWFPRAVSACEGLSRSSVVGRAAESAAREWRRGSLPERSLALGGVLLVAPVVHLGLIMWDGVPAGWLWLIIPVLSLVIGALLAGYARACPRRPA